MPTRDEIALTIAKMEAEFDGDEYFEWRALMPIWQKNYLAMADAVIALFAPQTAGQGT